MALMSERKRSNEYFVTVNLIAQRQRLGGAACSNSLVVALATRVTEADDSSPVSGDPASYQVARPTAKKAGPCAQPMLTDIRRLVYHGGTPRE